MFGWENDEDDSFVEEGVVRNEMKRRGVIEKGC